MNGWMILLALSSGLLGVGIGNILGMWLWKKTIKNRLDRMYFAPEEDFERCGNCQNQFYFDGRSVCTLKPKSARAREAYSPVNTHRKACESYVPEK